MLKKCAPDCVIEEKDHHIHVEYNGEWFRNLPTGNHSSGLIQRPWVKKMAQVLKILDCAKREIPSLSQ